MVILWVSLRLTPLQGLYSSVLNDYTTIISSILISRFIMDLRSLSSGKEVFHNDSHHISSLDFAPNSAGNNTYASEQTGTTSKWTSLVRDFEGTPLNSQQASWQMEERVASA